MDIPTQNRALEMTHQFEECAYQLGLAILEMERRAQACERNPALLIEGELVDKMYADCKRARETGMEAVLLSEQGRFDEAFEKLDQIKSVMAYYVPKGYQ